MASGSATFIYTGEEPVILQGVRFVPGEPTHITDQGLIAHIRSMTVGWEEFTERGPGVIYIGNPIVPLSNLPKLKPHVPKRKPAAKVAKK